MLNAGAASAGVSVMWGEGVALKGADGITLTDISGITGGTLYRALPVIAVTATRRQLVAVSRLPAVRSVYGNRTLQATSDPYVAAAGTERVARDSELTGFNAGAPLTVTDAYAIPSALRGYVAVALERGLLTSEGGSFRPQAALTRLELAHALSVFAGQSAE